jgi:hypothetical protein
MTREYEGPCPGESTRFWADEAGLAALAENYPVDDDHSAFLMLEAAILSPDVERGGATIQGGCELAVELLAGGDGEIDGYRLLIHPSGELDDPWIAGHIERVIDRDLLPEPDMDDGSYDVAQIVRDAVTEANRLLEWSER